MCNKIDVTCQICGKNEKVYKSRGSKYKTCSKECMGKMNSVRYSKKIEKICPECDKSFEVKPSSFKRRLCCSQKCLYKYKSKVLLIGDNNPNSKIRYILENGIYKKSYDRYKYPYQKICKDILGIKKWVRGYDIHHIDCDDKNNEPTNLVVIPHETHMLLHRLFGNILLRLIFSDNYFDDKELKKILTIEEYNFIIEIKGLNVTHQAVVKQCELLENPEVDNQQPSCYRNIIDRFND